MDNSEFFVILAGLGETLVRLPPYPDCPEFAVRDSVGRVKATFCREWDAVAYYELMLVRASQDKRERAFDRAKSWAKKLSPASSLPRAVPGS